MLNENAMNLLYDVELLQEGIFTKKNKATSTQQLKPAISKALKALKPEVKASLSKYNQLSKEQKATVEEVFPSKLGNETRGKISVDGLDFIYFQHNETKVIMSVIGFRKDNNKFPYKSISFKKHVE